MINEPTNDDLDNIESTEVAMTFTDKMVYLKNGTVLVTRILTNADDSDNNLVLFKPAQIITNLDGSMIMGDWMPQTDDDYIMLPNDRVMTTATPKSDVLNGYHRNIGVSTNSYLPDGETLH